MPSRDRGEKFVTLRSRGNEVVRVVGAGDRAFLEQADKLVLELTKRIEEKTVDPATPSIRGWGSRLNRSFTTGQVTVGAHAGQRKS